MKVKYVGEIMISLNRWKEFGVDTNESMKDSFEKAPYEGMEIIARYLENGQSVLSAPGVGIDCFTGEKVMDKREVLSDGNFTWSSMLPYYVRQYNLRLPSNIESTILNKAE